MITIFTVCFFQSAFEPDYFFRLENPIFYSILSVAFILLIIYFFTFKIVIPQRRKHEKELRDKEAERLKAITAYVNLANEKERERVAKELHDGIGQSLTYIKMTLNNIKDSQMSEKREEIYIDDMIEVVDQIGKEIRNIALGLKPKMLEELGLQPTLLNLLDGIQNKYKIKCSFFANNMAKRLNPDLEVSLFRIIQELLNNVIKHSRAKELILQINYENKSVNLTLSDNGIGFDVGSALNSKKGLGLLSLQERVFALNGIIEIDSDSESGTEIFIELPMEE